MSTQFSKRQFRAGNPLANALVVIVGVLAISASLILGVVAMVVLGSIVMILAAIIGIRVWWLNRRLMRQYKSTGKKSASQRVDVIEGEYRVITSDRVPDNRSRE